MCAKVVARSYPFPRPLRNQCFVKTSVVIIYSVSCHHNHCNHHFKALLNLKTDHFLRVTTLSLLPHLTIGPLSTLAEIGLRSLSVPFKQIGRVPFSWKTVAFSYLLGPKFGLLEIIEKSHFSIIRLCLESLYTGYSSISHCQAKQLQKVQNTTIPSIAAIIFCSLLWVSWIFRVQAIAFGFQCV